MTSECFNPTLVRLRPKIQEENNRLVLAFQSHAGSIEAHAEPPARTPPPGFQSHAGSIEAVDAATQRRKQPSRFNPTLVRLRRRKKFAGQEEI